MTKKLNIQNRFSGCLLAGAVGDALGGAIEFMSTRQIQSVFGASGLRNYIPAYGGLGLLTDDTQMTLFTAEGLVRAVQASPQGISFDFTLQAIHLAYLRWLRTQRGSLRQVSEADKRDGGLVTVPAMHAARAPGRTCLSALQSGVMGSVEQPINQSKGCGGVMRVAPVGMVGYRLGWDAGQVFKMGCEAAAITHGHPSGYLSAGCLATMIYLILQGAPLLDAISQTLDLLKDWPQHDECSEAIESALELWQHSGYSPGPASIAMLGEGWVGEEALAIAIYCALCAKDDMEQAIVLAINHGGDSDSTGSIAGNIMGALYGATAIPERWLSCLELRQEITDMATTLAHLLPVAPDHPSGND